MWELVIPPLLGLGSLATAYKSFFSPNRSVSVNCWFCNSNTKVSLRDQNRWTCPSCLQYNGFNTDGDYNDDVIHRSKNDDGKKIFYAVRRPLKESSSSNSLCNSCNLNQDLKVRQLAKFNPVNPDCYDEEVSNYEAHLERVYRLCRRCEAVLRQTLGEQDSQLRPGLLSWRIESNKLNDSIAARTLASNTFATPTLKSRIFVSILSVCAFFPQVYPMSATIVTLLLLLFYNASPYLVTQWKHKLTIGAWMSAFVLSSVVETPYYSTLTAVSSLLTLCTWNVHLTKRIKKKKKKKNWEQNREFRDEPLTSSTPAPSVISGPSADVSAISGPSEDVSAIAGPSEDVLAISSPSTSEDVSATNSTGSATAPIKSNKCDISSLSIDDETETEFTLMAEDQRSSSSPFLVKRYNSINNSGINFGRENDLDIFRQKRVFLRPPILISSSSSSSSSSRPPPAPSSPSESPSKQVAKSSWVAGGYWHPNDPLSSGQPETISRSSSQSSGFISNSGMINNGFTTGISAPPLAPTMMPPHMFRFPEQDRYSMVSDPIWRPNPAFTMRHRQRDSCRDSLSLGDEEEYSSKSPLKTKNVSSSSFMEKEFHVRISCYSILLCSSILANVILMAFVIYNVI